MQDVVKKPQLCCVDASAIIRESVEKFIQSSPPDCHQTVKAPTEQCKKTVDCTRNEKLSQECIDNFLTNLENM